MNDPLLFIDSVSDKRLGNENQETFDSRINNSKKKLIYHRIEDIKAMSFFKMNMYIVIKTTDGNFEGVLENIDDEAIYIRSNNIPKRVFINVIDDIIIKKL